MSLSTFQQDYFWTPIVGSGHFSRVYRISDKYVAKVDRSIVSPFSVNSRGDLHNSKKDNTLEEEYQILTELYEKGVSVPKPEGIFEVIIRAWPTAYGNIYPRKSGLVMEYVRGISGDDLEYYCEDTQQEIRINQKIRDEVEKATQLGFKPNDVRLDNVIYTPRTDKVTLIDFNKGWRRK